MKKKFRLKRSFNPGSILPGLFLFFILTSADSSPVIRYSVSQSAGFFTMSIKAFSLEPFKNSTLKIKYASGVDIENVSVATAVASLSVGASIDNSNSMLSISIVQTKKTSIDNAVLISVKYPSNNSVVPSDLILMEAQFTDYNGSTITVPVSNEVKVRQIRCLPEYSQTVQDRYYLLNGRTIAGTVGLHHDMLNRQNDRHIRIVQKADMQE